eukprot:tig00021105_g18251.t1
MLAQVLIYDRIRSLRCNLRPIKRQILWTTSIIALFTVAVTAPLVQTLARRGMLHSALNDKPDSCIWSLSFVVAAVMVARSPASAIAIMKELKAKGPLTNSMLGITVVCDVVVLTPVGFFFYAAADAIHEASEERLPVALSLTDIGEAVSTTLLAIIMINQLVGPLLQRPALMKAQEHNEGRGDRSGGHGGASVDADVDVRPVSSEGSGGAANHAAGAIHVDDLDGPGPYRDRDRELERDAGQVQLEMPVRGRRHDCYIN